MGLNFQYYDGLQPKIRAGIINEHECKIIYFLSEDQAKAVMRVDSNLGLDLLPKKATEAQMIITEGESKLSRLPHLT